MMATFTNSDGVICNPPNANHRCAPAFQPMPELPRNGRRTATNMTEHAARR